MEVQGSGDYSRFSENEYVYSLGLSVAAHLAILLLVWSSPWFMPQKEVPVPVFTISLLSMEGMGGGSGGEGGGGPAQTSVLEKPPAPPQSEPEPPEEKLAVPEPPEVVETPRPARMVVRKKEKPVPKPKPKPMVEQPQRERRPVGEETQPAAVPAVDNSPPAGPPGAVAEGSGFGVAEAGRGGGGSGPGTGGGSGGGAGQGVVNTAFGAADGPRFISKIAPKYPRLAREGGKEGTVLLCLTIDERGRLLNVAVTKGAGFGFDEAALEAVRNASFKPAMKNGVPMMCKAQLPVHFVLKNSRN